MAAPATTAAEVLASVPSYVWDGRGLPVPVEEIAESYAGLRVCECDDLADVPDAPPLAPDERLSGLLVVDRRQIWVNAVEAEKSPGRRRFTIGHELGHWFLHATEHQKIFCRAHGVDPETAPADTPDIEAEASEFAATLLFPDALVRREWDASSGDLLAVCERFGGSRVATERAVFRAAYAPAIRARAHGFECFFHDDAGYERWRDEHLRAGFVVNDVLADPSAARLHRLTCSYLTGPAQAGQPRTRHPKWCSEDVEALRRTFPGAKACTRCRP